MWLPVVVLLLQQAPAVLHTQRRLLESLQLVRLLRFLRYLHVLLL